MRNHLSFNLNINVVHSDDVACHCRRFSHVDLPDLSRGRAGSFHTRNDSGSLYQRHLLDHSPLVVVMTASFIHKTEVSVAKYTEIYRKGLTHQDALRQNPLLRSELKNLSTTAISTICDISFSRVKRELPSAADLLQLISALDSRNVNSKVTKIKDLEATLRLLNSFSFFVVCELSRCQVHNLVAI